MYLALFVASNCRSQRERNENVFQGLLFSQYFTPAVIARNWEVIFYNNLDIREHIYQICLTHYYHIRYLRYLFQTTIATALITSELACCSFLC